MSCETQSIIVLNKVIFSIFQIKSYFVLQLVGGGQRISLNWKSIKLKLQSHHYHAAALIKAMS
jgi:hypothetical protein